MHTPGPWSIHSESGSRFICSPTSSGMPVIAELRDKSIGLYYAKQTQDANARLIAAAPDLLAALKRFVEPWNAGGDYMAKFNYDTFKDAAIAIQKAVQP